MTSCKAISHLAIDSTARLYLLLLVMTLVVNLSAATWAKQAQDDSPRELARMSASLSFNTKDDLPLDLQDETAISMLYRLRKASPATLDRFAAYTRDVTLDDAREDTIDYRFWLFRSSAQLKKVEKVTIVDAPKTSDSIQHYYRCTAEATDAEGKPLSCTILSRVVPSQLPLDTAIDEPIKFTGFLYARAELGGLSAKDKSAGPATADDQAKPETEPTSEEEPLNQTIDRSGIRENNGKPKEATLKEATKTLVFIADRLAWFPNTPAIADKRMIGLAADGFDVSQLDQIRRRNGKPLGGGDSEAFYRMLATIAAQPADYDNGSPVLPIKTIIAKSIDNLGARVTVTARCRDCTRVEVTDPDRRERYGINHYYQLVLFPELNQSITLTENTDDGPVKVVYERFPITVCAIKLPKGVYVEDVKGEALLVEGTFFRIWKYDAEINQRAKTSGTISPLIIAPDFEIITTPQWLKRLISWGLGGIAVAFAFFFAYRRVFKNRERRPSESIIDSLPDELDVTGLD